MGGGGEGEASTTRHSLIHKEDEFMKMVKDSQRTRRKASSVASPASKRQSWASQEASVLASRREALRRPRQPKAEMGLNFKE